MNAQESALVAIARFLDAGGVPYMVIGGMANAIWGVPRATLDVDVTVWAGDVPSSALLDSFAAAFRSLVARPAEFVRDTRVLPLESTEGVRIDVIFGALPFEEEAIERAVLRTVAGSPVRFCTAEDLVLLKIVSERDRDRADVAALLQRRGATLDRAYLDPRVAEFAALLERSDILADYHRWLGLT
ncbi:MAG: nucleotidyltransferase [Myxococcota bacterium]